MIKIVLPSSYDFDQHTAQLVNFHRSGVDQDWFTKRAAAPAITFDGLRPKKDHSLIHLIAMGASDYYGENRNGDTFFKYGKLLNLENPDWEDARVRDGSIEKKSAATFTDRTKTGLRDRFKTFEKYAHVFKHHKNKPDQGDKIYGEVKQAAYNDPMERVELLIEVPNNEWEEELQKLASGEDVPFSMACFVDPKFPILTSYGYQPVSEMARNQWVLTHTGKWRRVTATTRRQYTGKVYKIHVSSYPAPIVVTEDHLWLAQIDATNSKLVLDQNDARDKKPVGWLHTRHLKKGDKLIYRIPHEFPHAHEIENEYICRALADFISGGSFSGEIFDRLEKYVSPSEVYPGIFNSSLNIKLAFIATVFDSLNAEINDTYLSWIDMNLGTVLSMRDLLFSAGIPVHIMPVSVKPTRGDKKGKSTPGYQLNIPVEYVKPLVPYSELLSREDVYPHVSVKFKELDERYEYDICHPVEILNIEVDNVENTTVYNFEVEDEHSYLAGGICSHNCNVDHDICSYCGHKASSRDKYCEHLSYGLTDLLKSGHVISAVNENPTFIDISKVRRPADRIAWSLQKAASSLVLAADLAEDPDFKIYPDVSVLMQEHSDPRIAKRAELAAKLAEMEKRVPMDAKLIATAKGSKVLKPLNDKKLKQLANKHDKCAALFRALCDENVCLPLDKFAEVVIGSSGAVDKLVSECRPALKGMYSSFVTDGISNPVYDPQNSTADGYSQKVAQDLAPDLALNPQRILNNFIKVSAYGQDEDIDFSVPSQLSKQASELLNQYGAYQLSFLEDVKKRRSGDLNQTMELLIAQNCVQ